MLYKKEGLCFEDIAKIVKEKYNSSIHLRRGKQ